MAFIAMAADLLRQRATISFVAQHDANRRRRLQEFLSMRDLSFATLTEDEVMEFASLIDPRDYTRGWDNWVVIKRDVGSTLYLNTALLFVGTYEEAIACAFPKSRNTYDVVVDLISGKIKQVRDDALIYAGLETNLEPHGKAMHPAETPYEFCKALENFPLPAFYSGPNYQRQLYPQAKKVDFTIVHGPSDLLHTNECLFLTAADHFLNPTLCYRQTRILLVRVAMYVARNCLAQEKLDLPHDYAMFIAMLKERAFTKNLNLQTDFFRAWYRCDLSLEFLGNGQLQSLNRCCTRLRKLAEESIRRDAERYGALLVKLLSAKELRREDDVRSVPAVKLRCKGYNNAREYISKRRFEAFGAELVVEGGIARFGKGLEKLGLVKLVEDLEEVDGRGE